MQHNSLFQEFPKVSAKAWKQKIQVDLKGADYNETLVWESSERIKVKPFYSAEDRSTETPPLTPATWGIGQSIYAANATMANEKALDALARGAERLVFTIPEETVAIAQLLKGIDLKSTLIYFDLQFLSASYVQQLLEYAGEQRSHIHLNIDPIGHLAREGNWFFSLEKDHKILDQILQASSGETNSPTLGVDASLYQNAGANMVQQLAYALAHAHEYLHHGKEGTSLPITFKMAVGTNYFFEIAKLRALRWLWKTIASEYGNSTDCHILAVPTRRNKTLYDYNVNLLRTTTECMAAIVGGADTICNLPYDAIYHKDNEFGERISRNQLLVLKEESYFDKVGNPADGAYYIESLTRQLADKALELFKEIEKNGGFLKQLKAHHIQKKIQESAQKEETAFNEGKEILLGTNLYKNDADRMSGELELFPFVKTRPRKTLIPPIIEKRLAETMEQTRLEHE